jgi:hypothetical protein
MLNKKYTHYSNALNMMGYAAAIYSVTKNVNTRYRDLGLNNGELALDDVQILVVVRILNYGGYECTIFNIDKLVNLIRINRVGTIYKIRKLASAKYIQLKFGKIYTLTARGIELLEEIDKICEDTLGLFSQDGIEDILTS